MPQTPQRGAFLTDAAPRWDRDSANPIAPDYLNRDVTDFRAPPGTETGCSPFCGMRGMSASLSVLPPGSGSSSPPAGPFFQKMQV